jgi:hypothetical protein
VGQTAPLLRGSAQRPFIDLQKVDQLQVRTFIGAGLAMQETPGLHANTLFCPVPCSNFAFIFCDLSLPMQVHDV